MFASNARRARADLAEALREIHIMSGLDPADRANEQSRRPLAIGVTSPRFSDGKTTVAIALARSLAEDFQTEVTLVDCDFHTHSLEREYGLLDELGLSDLLDGERPLETVSHRVSPSRLRLITAGRARPDPARLARSERLSTLVDSMKQTNQYVVIDLPATLQSMNAPILAKRCDGVIVVVNCGRTTRPELERVLHLLTEAKILGVVINRQESAVPVWVRRMVGLRAD
jgi:capsular exopolysaccharide synthesis family protein